MNVRTWISRQLESHERRDREEAARLRALSSEERSQLLRSLSASVLGAVLALPEEQRRRALELRDPLPESSVRAWKRLREAHGHAARR